MIDRVRLLGNEGTPEYQAGIHLKNLFEDQIPKAVSDVSIIIATNVTLFGQEVKDIDIIVIGRFGKGFSKSLRFSLKDEDEILKRNVYFNNFCAVIELKNHAKEDIAFGNLGNLLVKYNGKFHDATYQNERQKYSLLNYLKNFEGIKYSPYIVNLIWLKKVSSNEIFQMIGRRQHNFLPSNFKIEWFLQLACVQNKPYEVKNNSANKSSYFTFSAHKNLVGSDLTDFEKAFQLFNEVKQNTGMISRQHFERLSRKVLEGQKYAQAILDNDKNGKFVIFSGRAGTGKTVKLLTVASDLCVNYGYRCLILTFNFALVADLRRTLTLAGIPDSAGQESVRIITLHKFFIDLLEGFQIIKRSDLPEDKEFFENYPKYCQALLSFIDKKKESDEPLEMTENHQAIDWDYVLVDEAQDWLNEEIDLLYKIFGPSRIIIARASDQMVRSGKSAKWIKPRWKPNTDYVQTNEKKSLRQKNNLVKFVNTFAEKFNIPGWELEPNESFSGGKVIITSDYTYDLHLAEYDSCEKSGNKAYEMMFIVPNTLIERGVKEITNKQREGIESTTQIVKTSRCRLVNEFKGKINFWDGTDKNLRREYPVEIDQHRIIPYDACRGLEGWTVVCMNLDEFVAGKARSYKEEVNQDQLTIALETPEEKKQNFINLWALIPLTRAIDTLIIVVKDPNSSFAKKLYEVYRENSEFVEWKI